MIKRAWVTNHGNESRPIYSISIRSDDNYLTLSDPVEMPPYMRSYEKDNLMSLAEAKKLGVQEIHRSISMFTFEDLVILRDALIKATEGIDG